jgi:hypothetical protein
MVTLSRIGRGRGKIFDFLILRLPGFLAGEGRLMGDGSRNFRPYGTTHVLFLSLSAPASLSSFLPPKYLYLILVLQNIEHRLLCYHNNTGDEADTRNSELVGSHGKE